MTKIQFSANTGFLWKPLPFIERIKSAARYGFDAVEFHDEAQKTDLSALQDTLAEFNIPVISLNTNMGEMVGCAAIPGNEKQARQEIDQAVSVVNKIGSKAIHVLSGKVEDEVAEKTYISNLNHALSSSDCTIFIEPISPKAIPGYWMNSLEKALQVIETVNHPRLKIMFDFFHINPADKPWLDIFKTCQQHVGHIQISSLSNRHEPDQQNPDYRALLPQLIETGYKGHFGREYVPRSATENDLAYLNWF